MKIGDNSSFKMINNYLDKGQMPKLRNSTMLNELIVQEEEAIKKERFTFEVLIPKWTKTTGEFVEYQIHIRYLEGDKQQWEIHRRFSDFQELSILLKDHFIMMRKADPNCSLPQVPPKIPYDKITNHTLD